MKKEELLYQSDKEKEATERVLAFIKVKTISKEVDELVSEVITYASNIDKLLSRNGLSPRYLDRVGSLGSLSLIYVDEDIDTSDFRVREIVEDLIKRINTRITLIKSHEELIRELKEEYPIEEKNIVDDINLAHLKLSDFNV